MSYFTKRPDVICGLNYVDEYSIGNIPGNLVFDSKILKCHLVATLEVEFNGITYHASVNKWLNTEQGQWVLKHGHKTGVFEMKDVSTMTNILKIYTFLTLEKITFYTIKFSV
jgi:hypothetical protein